MPRLLEVKKDVVLVKSCGDGKRDSIRRYPNGTTWQVEDLSHPEVS